MSAAEAAVPGSGDSRAESARAVAAGAASWLLATGLVLGFLLWIWLSNGVSATEAVLYLVYLGGCVLLPGVLVALALDRRPFGLTHICVGAPLGLVQLMFAFIVLAAIGARGVVPWEPLGVAAVAAVALRRGDARVSWRRPLAQSLRWEAFVVAAIAIVSAGLMVSRDIAPNPLPAQISGPAILNSDLLWHTGNVAMLKEYWPPRDLRVLGASFKLYIGDYLQAANTSVATGTAPETIMQRLDPVFFLALVALQVFWVGRLLTRSARAGVTAAFLALLVGDMSVFAGATVSDFLNIALRDMYPSQNYLLALTMYLGLTGVTVTWLREGAPVRSPRLVIIASLMLGAALCKTPAVFVVLGASAFLVAVEALARRRLSRGGAILAVLAAGSYLVLSPLIRWSGQTGSMHVRVGGSLTTTIAWARLTGTALDRVPLHLLVIVAVVAGNMPAIWLGIGAFLRRRGLRLAEEELFVALLALAGAAIVIIFKADGNSQFDFWYFGYFAAALLAAAGVDLVIRTRGRARMLFLLPFAVLSLAGFGSIVLQSGPQARAALARVAPGVPGPFQNPVLTEGEVTPQVISGLLWLRDHTPARSVVAVNNTHGIAARGSDRYFYYATLSERQLLLGSWGYSQASAALLARREVLEQAIFVHGSTAAIRMARRRFGVDYLLVDRRSGLPQPRLDPTVARKVYVNPDIAIYRVVATS